MWNPTLWVEAMPNFDHVKRLLLILFLFPWITACDNVTIAFSTPEEILDDIPLGFPAIEYPAENEFTMERWLLGRKLFYDPILSDDYSVSCASCHDSELAFAVNEQFSRGAGQAIGTRNAPSLANVAYHPYYTREGGVPTLEMQILIPIQEHNEFNTNILIIAERMLEDETYVEMSQAAYDRPPDPYVITRSIANFERTLISGNSAYDRYKFQNKSQALTAQEKMGMELFFSERTRCSQCHADFNFTNYAFENNGLYASYPDPGRFRLTRDSMDLARFKVPSLRNVELTAPYMHDGSFDKLSDVLKHYNAGGANHRNKSELIQPLNLSSGELEALEAFLKSLTDHNFITNNTLKDEN